MNTRSPVLDALTKQWLSRARGRLIDLDALYEVAGRPAGQDPRAWDALNPSPRLVPDRRGRCLVDRHYAGDYAAWIDPGVRQAVSERLDVVRKIT